MSHGVDDVIGGKAEIVRIKKVVSGDHTRIWIETSQHPGVKYNWEYLAEEQERLKEKFGESKAYPDPDDRPEFNQWD